MRGRQPKRDNCVVLVFRVTSEVKAGTMVLNSSREDGCLYFPILSRIAGNASLATGAVPWVVMAIDLGDLYVDGNSLC